MADFNGKEDTSLRDALNASFSDPEPAANPPLPAETNDQAAVAPQPSPAVPRDEAGRFAPKEAASQPAAPSAAPAAAAPSGPTPAAGAPLTAQQPAAAERPMAPPPGFSPTTKAIWDKPTWDANDITAFKKDIAKREGEIEKGFAKLRDYKDMEPYVEMARNSGTTITDAVKRYVEAEKFLETEPEKGLLWLCQNYGIDPRRLVQAAFGNGAQPQPQAGANEQQPQPQPRIDLQPIMAPIMQELQNLRGIVYGDKQAQTQQTVSAFFADPAHVFAENVADDMARLISNGMASDLNDAYDKACGMNPEIRQILINEGQTKLAASQAAKAKTVADQARAAGRSITGGLGAPNGTSAPSDTLRATLEDAFANAARV